MEYLLRLHPGRFQIIMSGNSDIYFIISLRPFSRSPDSQPFSADALLKCQARAVRSIPIGDHGLEAFLGFLLQGKGAMGFAGIRNRAGMKGSGIYFMAFSPSGRVLSMNRTLLQA